MILYFTGTGNSRWAAEQLSTLLNDPAICITGTSPEDIHFSENDKLGIVFPVYAWNVPSPMTDFLKKVNIPKNTYCFSVCTCGADCGKAIEKLQDTIGQPISAALSLVMPNNYILSGDCDDIKKSKKRIAKASGELAKFAETVKASGNSYKLRRGPAPTIQTNLISPFFFKFTMTDKPFFVEDTCISCGLCATGCPVGNITLSDGKPTWNGHCCMCLSCINRCPKEAIQYTKSTKGRRRYYFTDNLLK